VEAADAAATFDEASAEGASPAAAEALAAAVDATAADGATTADGPPTADGAAAADGATAAGDGSNGSVVDGAADTSAAAAGTSAAAAGTSAAAAGTSAAAAGTSAAAAKRQRLSEGLAHFGRQVVGDFHAACEDAKDAFRPKGCPAAREDRLRLADKVSTVPAAVIGAVVAARMAPVRLTRLAARSAAAVAGRDVPADLDAAAAPMETSSGEPAEREAEATAAEGRLGAQACVAKEVEHFARQVTQDFHSARADVKAAFGYIVGDLSAPSESPTAGGQDSVAPPEPTPTQEPLLREGQQHPQPWSARSAVPALASTIAGVTVAGTLIPVRVLRLAVAGTAAAASAAAPVRGDAEAAPAPAAAEPPSTEEGAAAPPEPIPAIAPAAVADEELARRLQAGEVFRGQVAEDESLARRLQAEEDAAASTARAAAP